MAHPTDEKARARPVPLPGSVRARLLARAICFCARALNFTDELT